MDIATPRQKQNRPQETFHSLRHRATRGGVSGPNAGSGKKGGVPLAAVTVASAVRKWLNKNSLPTLTMSRNAPPSDKAVRHPGRPDPVRRAKDGYGKGIRAATAERTYRRREGKAWGDGKHSGWFPTHDALGARRSGCGQRARGGHRGQLANTSSAGQGRPTSHQRHFIVYPFFVLGSSL